MLFLIATPIGNLKDITLRALETLQEVDLILCEDTRRSGILLKAYNIQKPLKSFHKFSEKKGEDFVVAALQEGKKIALISDAGTPGISDPGMRLVARCRVEGIEVTALPGPSSPIVALTLTGFLFDKFQFVGFLPKKGQELKEELIKHLFYPGVTICFESPQRVEKTLQLLATLGPEHKVAVARELTKIHEECLVGTAKELLAHKIRGEVVLIIEGYAQVKPSLSPKEHVAYLQKTFGLDKSEALKLMASLHGLSKNEAYSCLISPK